jgi:hypothetical protein
MNIDSNSKSKIPSFLPFYGITNMSIEDIEKQWEKDIENQQECATLPLATNMISCLCVQKKLINDNWIQIVDSIDTIFTSLAIKSILSCVETKFILSKRGRFYWIVDFENDSIYKHQFSLGLYTSNVERAYEIYYFNPSQYNTYIFYKFINYINDCFTKKLLISSNKPPENDIMLTYYCSKNKIFVSGVSWKRICDKINLLLNSISKKELKEYKMFISKIGDFFWEISLERQINKYGICLKSTSNSEEYEIEFLQVILDLKDISSSNIDARKDFLSLFYANIEKAMNKTCFTSFITLFSKE